MDPKEQVYYRRSRTFRGSQVGDVINATIVGFDDAGRPRVSVKRLPVSPIQNEHPVGDRLTGQVKTIVNFGAFVATQGIEGLIHVSEIPHAENGSVEDHLAVGDNVIVRILQYDMNQQRTSFSLVGRDTSKASPGTERADQTRELFAETFRTDPRSLSIEEALPPSRNGWSVIRGTESSIGRCVVCSVQVGKSCRCRLHTETERERSRGRCPPYRDCDERMGGTKGRGKDSRGIR